jgi:hypothetical protein
MNCLATLLPQIRLWHDDDYDHIFNKCISATFNCFAFRKLQYQQGSGKKKQNYKISRQICGNYTQENYQHNVVQWHFMADGQNYRPDMTSGASQIAYKATTASTKFYRPFCHAAI